MKKKLLSLVMLFVLLVLAMPSTVFAGNANIDSSSGGGYSGDGSTGDTFWNGESGVRLSIVDLEGLRVLGAGKDYTNAAIPAEIRHFGKSSKMSYVFDGSRLNLKYGKYTREIPATTSNGQTMPRIVSGNGNNIEAIRRYFGSKEIAGMVAKDFGFDYDTLTSGYYLLFVEPLLFVKFRGNNYAMTAHEAALFNKQLESWGRATIRDSYVGNVSHRDLPLSMFLEDADVGFLVPPGGRSGLQTDATILQYLGLGTVHFAEQLPEPPPPPPPPPDQQPEPPPPPTTYVAEYRPNTTVITSVTLNAPSDVSFPTYDPPVGTATVTFTVHKTSGDEIHTMADVAIPAGGSQLVWAKWKTPKDEQVLWIDVATDRGHLSENRIEAKIAEIVKDEPPDPKATDDRPKTFDGKAAMPSNVQRSSASWSVWRAYLDVRYEWRTYIVSYKDATFGTTQYRTHHVQVPISFYNFAKDEYSASLTAKSNITPDDRVPTATGNQFFGYTIKSGYGFNNKIDAALSGSFLSTHVAAAQTAICWFPEFNYRDHPRVLEATQQGPNMSTLEFKKNKYSTYNNRVHFTPLWFPDGRYDIYTQLIDAWTPAGMLSKNLPVADWLIIDGAVFEDWHIGPIE